MVKSQTRPQNDRDPTHPELLVLTANSFEELVINSEHDVLVDIYADWCGPCRMVAPVLQKLAKVLKGFDSIRIAKMNCDLNDIDPTYFPEPSIPNIKFFTAKNKKEPIKYTGKRTLSDFLKFIKANSSKPLDLDELIKTAEIDDHFEFTATKASKQIHQVREMLTKFKNELKEDEIKNIETLLTDLDKLINSKENKEQAIQQINDKLKLFEDASANLKQIAEKAELKNVIKITSETEYKNIHEQAGDKLIVVDFYATWCGPCKFIAPFFADLSDNAEFKDKVIFVKVDADKFSKIAKDSGVTCYPTFHAYKNGKKVGRLEGADPYGLLDLIKKNM